MKINPSKQISQSRSIQIDQLPFSRSLVQQINHLALFNKLISPSISNDIKDRAKQSNSIIKDSTSYSKGFYQAFHMDPSCYQTLSQLMTEQKSLAESSQSARYLLKQSAKLINFIDSWNFSRKQQLSIIDQKRVINKALNIQQNRKLIKLKQNLTQRRELILKGNQKYTENQSKIQLQESEKIQKYQKKQNGALSLRLPQQLNLDSDIISNQAYICDQSSIKASSVSSAIILDLASSKPTEKDGMKKIKLRNKNKSQLSQITRSQYQRNQITYHSRRSQQDQKVPLLKIKNGRESNEIRTLPNQVLKGQDYEQWDHSVQNQISGSNIGPVKYPDQRRSLSPKVQGKRKVTVKRFNIQKEVLQRQAKDLQIKKVEELEEGENIDLQKEFLGEFGQGQKVIKTDKYENKTLKLIRSKGKSGFQPRDSHAQHAIPRSSFIPQQQPWECDQLQLQQQIKKIDQKIQDRRSGLIRDEVQQVKIQLNVETCTNEANPRKYQEYLFDEIAPELNECISNEPKIVRLSLTPSNGQNAFHKRNLSNVSRVSNAKKSRNVSPRVSNQNQCALQKQTSVKSILLTEQVEKRSKSPLYKYSSKSPIANRFIASPILSSSRTPTKSKSKTPHKLGPEQSKFKNPVLVSKFRQYQSSQLDYDNSTSHLIINQDAESEIYKINNMVTPTSSHHSRTISDMIESQYSRVLRKNFSKENIDMNMPLPSVESQSNLKVKKWKENPTAIHLTQRITKKPGLEPKKRALLSDQLEDI